MGSSHLISLALNLNNENSHNKDMNNYLHMSSYSTTDQCVAPRWMFISFESVWAAKN